MKEYNLIEDLSVLTSIPRDALDKLSKKCVWVICDDLEDCELENDNLVSINIGIGNLLISNGDETIKYKFIPSKELEKGIRETVVDHKNPLKFVLEKTLADRITNTYKTII